MGGDRADPAVGPQDVTRVTAVAEPVGTRATGGSALDQPSGAQQPRSAARGVLADPRRPWRCHRRTARFAEDAGQDRTSLRRWPLATCRTIEHDERRVTMPAASVAPTRTPRPPPSSGADDGVGSGPRPRWQGGAARRLGPIESTDAGGRGDARCAGRPAMVADCVRPDGDELRMGGRPIRLLTIAGCRSSPETDDFRRWQSSRPSSSTSWSQAC